MDPVIFMASNMFRLVVDNEDSEEELIENNEGRIRRRNFRIKNFMQIVRSMRDTEFHRHFRFHRTTTEFILRIIAPDLQRQGLMGRNPIHPRIQLLMALWLIGTPESYRSVCNRFDIGDATGHRAVRRVTDALAQRASIFIRWPTPNEAAVSMQRFYAKRQFPRVIGAIDGTHIQITKPKRDAVNYINRKGYYSISMQAVCDHRLKFIHCYVGEVGSVHDARVLVKSRFAKFWHDAKFPNNSHVLGDSAYGISKYLLTPYKDGRNLSIQQQNYNFCHSSTRMVIERAFGLLKGKSRRILEKLPMYNTQRIPRFITAMCVLHNINIERNNLDNIDLTPNPVNLPLGERRQREGEEKRRTIKDNLRHQLPV